MALPVTSDLPTLPSLSLEERCDLPDMDGIRLYTDGACIGNPGPGGWAYVFPNDGDPVEACGSDARTHTTNNKMELTAAIRGLEATPVGRTVSLTTDSDYVVKGMTEWLPKWQSNGWRNSKKESVANRDLWERLVELAAVRAVTWRWVKGHADENAGGDRWNHRCDELASTQAVEATAAAIARGERVVAACIATARNGRVCRRPATILDRARGGLVCATHAPAATGAVVVTPREDAYHAG
jgi:ribonuclease HI